MAIVERWVETVEESICLQSHGVAKEREVEVGIGVNLQLSGILALEPCLGGNVVVQIAALRLYELCANA